MVTQRVLIPTQLCPALIDARVHPKTRAREHKQMEETVGAIVLLCFLQRKPASLLTSPN